MDAIAGRIGFSSKILFILSVLLIIQFFNPEKNKDQFNKKRDFLFLTNAPDEVVEIFKNSCYDCHSNNTEYRWFDVIAPVSFWIDDNINNGKRAMNLSEWDNAPGWQRLSFLNAIVFDLKIGKMPPKEYIWMHDDAVLSSIDRKLIIDWINSIDRTSEEYNLRTH